MIYSIINIKVLQNIFNIVLWQAERPIKVILNIYKILCQGNGLLNIPDKKQLRAKIIQKRLNDKPASSCCVFQKEIQNKH